MSPNSFVQLNLLSTRYLTHEDMESTGRMGWQSHLHTLTHTHIYAITSQLSVWKRSSVPSVPAIIKNGDNVRVESRVPLYKLSKGIVSYNFKQFAILLFFLLWHDSSFFFIHFAFRTARVSVLDGWAILWQFETFICSKDVEQMT